MKSYCVLATAGTEFKEGHFSFEVSTENTLSGYGALKMESCPPSKLFFLDFFGKHIKNFPPSNLFLLTSLFHDMTPNVNLEAGPLCLFFVLFFGLMRG